jgi:PKD repeat protein
VRAIDTAGNTDPTPAQQTWTVQAPPPSANFTVTCKALACKFDGSSSADTNGTITSYAWDLGDGASAAGSTVSHRYPRAGSYIVTLTVTDNAGASASVSKTVAVTSPRARLQSSIGRE